MKMYLICVTDLEYPRWAHLPDLCLLSSKRTHSLQIRHNQPLTSQSRDNPHRCWGLNMQSLNCLLNPRHTVLHTVRETPLSLVKEGRGTRNNQWELNICTLKQATDKPNEIMVSRQTLNTHPLRRDVSSPVSIVYVSWINTIRHSNKGGWGRRDVALHYLNASFRSPVFSGP